MDSIRVVFEWTCPYCGLKQWGRADIVSQSNTAQKIVCCDLELGGCEQHVALFVDIAVNVDVYKLVEVSR